MECRDRYIEGHDDEPENHKIELNHEGNKKDAIY
jgi:hypothetical protein